MEFIVFYAWQSDAPRRINKDFIREAAQLSIQEITTEAGLEDSPRLDHDTDGVAGMPEIASTIFNKIGNCDVFLADVTLVGNIERKNKNKKTPNPNVLLELGYAAARIGWDRLICVMNEHYGVADEQIFDIRHRRFPIRYTLAPDSSKDQAEAARKKLTRSLGEAISMARYAEHELVNEIISSLDEHCIGLMRDLGRSPWFRSEPRDTVGKVLGFQSRDSAVVRMLALKIVRCEQLPSDTTYIYRWTHLGKLILEKLGFRLALAPV